MRHTLLRFGLVTVAAGGLAPAAPAFYWVGWPGAGTTQPPSIVSQTERVEYRPPPGRTLEPPGGQPPGGQPPEEPTKTPEPATLTLAAAGLGVLAVRWVRKRKKK